jgi:hypothetical protein
MTALPAITPSIDPYEQFLRNKRYGSSTFGIPPKGIVLPEAMFPLQGELTLWALVQGRAALFADTGLGKTLMELVWADNIVRHTNKSVLILTPLAVGAQTVREGEKFGIASHRSLDGKLQPGAHIVVANYERLHYFNPDDFAGVVCDESSILKNFKGVRRQSITSFLQRVRYRLLATATPSPNDYTELGTSSEALSYLGHMDMLGTFFTTNEGTLHPTAFDAKYKFKAHAQTPFWRWVCSWARAVRRPSDMGFSDEGFILPALLTNERVVVNHTPPPGALFALQAITRAEQIVERRMTIRTRCERVAELLDHRGSALAWCHLDDEGDLLEHLIPDAVQVSGRDSDDAKEEKLLAFASGQIKKCIIKPTIGGWGLNWQHCNHMTFFPSHSFEQYYQGVRRCWRYGQTLPVTVDVVTTEGELGVLKNLQRKAEAADQMFSLLVSHMNDALGVARTQTRTTPIEVPTWLQ